MKERDGSYTTRDELFVDAPPERIYELLVDFNNRHTWWKSNRARLLNGGEAKEGAQVALCARHWIFPVRFLMRIKKLQPARLIRLDVEKGLIRGTCEWQIEPRGRGAVVRLMWEGVRPEGIVATALFAMSGDRKHSQHVSFGLAGLKAHFFKSPPPKEAIVGHNLTK